MSKELSPEFRRYWIKVLEDGTKISQFDEEGKYTLWDNTIKPMSVIFRPFTQDMVDRLSKAGEVGVVTSLPDLTFKVDQKAEYYRKCTIDYIPHTKCRFCGTDIAEGVEMVCPVCLGRNWFYCTDCDELKSDPKRVGNESFCPDCAEPTGLLWIGCIVQDQEENLSYVHVLEIDGNKHIILDVVKA
jgi:hypothetical protein